MKFSVVFSKITPLSSLIAALDSNKCQKDEAENCNKEDLSAVFIAIISHFVPLSVLIRRPRTEKRFSARRRVFLCTKVTVHIRVLAGEHF